MLDLDDSPDCQSCGTTLYLIDGHEWPDDDRLCWGCLHEQRDALLVACKRALETFGAETCKETMDEQEAERFDVIYALTYEIAKAEGKVT